MRSFRALQIALACTAGLLIIRAVVDVPHGLRGEYFTDPELHGDPLFVERDSAVSIPETIAAWRTAPPAVFAVRWRGFVAVRQAGTYEFATTSDDGSRLWIDGREVVDNSGQHAALTRAGRVRLDAGSHQVVLEYVQLGGPLALEWSWGRDGSALTPVPGWLLSTARVRFGRIAAAVTVDWLLAAAVIATAAIALALAIGWVRHAASARVGEAVAMLLLFAALSVVHTWPLASDPGGWSRNDNDDTMYCEWAMAWVVHQAARAPLHLFDANIFYPERNTLAYSESLVVQGAIGAPLRCAGASPVFTYNVVLMAGYALTGWAMWFVLARWTGDRIAALGGGLAIGFSAHTLARMPHMQAQHVEFLPLALLALDRVIDRARLRDAVSLALWASLQALTSFYLLVMTGVALAAALVVRPDAWTRERRSRVLRCLGGAAALAVGLLLPLLLPYYRLALANSGFTRPLSEAAIYVASWRDYLTSPGRIPRALFGGMMSATALYPGAAASGLAAVAVATGIAFRDRRARMCIAFGLCGVVLSFGPAVPGYAWLYRAVPLFQGVRAVSRFGYLALFAVAALSAFGFAKIRQSLAHPRVRAAVSTALLAAIAIEPMAAPIWYQRFDGIPRIYDRLAEEPNAIVLELPMPIARGVFFNAPYELASTVHWRRLVNGYSGFIPPSYNEHVEIFRALPALHAMGELRRLGVTHVVVHRAELPAGAAASFDAAAGLQKLAEQGDIVIYRVGD